MDDLYHHIRFYLGLIVSKQESWKGKELSYVERQRIIDTKEEELAQWLVNQFEKSKNE